MEQPILVIESIPTAAPNRWNWTYPLGFLGLGFVNALFSQWMVYFHAPPNQPDPAGKGALIGTILLLGYLVQGVVCPILGNWSDRLRHPWGRRRPFMILGCIPLALVFYGAWLSNSFWWSLVMICLYGFFFVMVMQSYVSLLPEIAPRQEQRVKLGLIGGSLSLVATGVALIGGPLLLEKSSFATLGAAGGLALVLTVWLPALLIHEPLPENPPNAKPLLQDMAELLRNRSMINFMLGSASVVILMISLTILSPYLSETLMGQPRTYTSTLNSFLFAGIIMAIVFTSTVGKRWSFMVLVRNLVFVNSFVLLLFGVGSLMGTIPLPIWWVGFVSLGWMVLVAMMAPTIVLAEYSDRDGQGRQGAIFGLNGLGFNLANALASQVTAGLLTLGHDATHPVGVKLVLLFAFLAALGGLVGLTRAIRLLPK